MDRHLQETHLLQYKLFELYILLWYLWDSRDLNNGNNLLILNVDVGKTENYSKRYLNYDTGRRWSDKLKCRTFQKHRIVIYNPDCRQTALSITTLGNRKYLESKFQEEKNNTHTGAQVRLTH